MRNDRKKEIMGYQPLKRGSPARWLGSASEIRWRAQACSRSSRSSCCFSVSRGATRGGSGIWSGCLLGVSLGRRFRACPTRRSPLTDLGDNGELIFLGWSGNALVSPRRGGGRGWGQEGLGLAAKAFGPPNPEPHRRKKTLFFQLLT